ncbi:MAG: hypothetical protein AAF404_13610, partial [Pseudomonadota bacterium]
YFTELDKEAGNDTRYDTFVGQLKKDIMAADYNEVSARSISSRLARALQAAMLMRHGIDASSEYFLQTRIAREHGIYGASADTRNHRAIIDHAMPAH